MIEAAGFHLTGAPALVIILAILALIVVGIVATVRFVGGKARDAVKGDGERG
jgi:L-asparagine transporter-like permease